MRRERNSPSGPLPPCTREVQIRSVASRSPGLYVISSLSQTVSVSNSFFLAMALYPEVQAKAQSEIDRVIGSDRLPGFQDRDSLPYLNALTKEVLRWNPVSPLGTG